MPMISISPRDRSVAAGYSQPLGKSAFRADRRSMLGFLMECALERLVSGASRAGRADRSRRCIADAAAHQLQLWWPGPAHAVCDVGDPGLSADALGGPARGGESGRAGYWRRGPAGDTLRGVKRGAAQGTCGMKRVLTLSRSPCRRTARPLRAGPPGRLCASTPWLTGSKQKKSAVAAGE